MSKVQLGKRRHGDGDAPYQARKIKKTHEDTHSSARMATRFVTRIATAGAVLDTTELLEAIFLATTRNETFRLRSICQHWKKVIETSPDIQAHMFPKGLNIATAPDPKIQMRFLRSPPTYTVKRAISPFIRYEHFAEDWTLTRDGETRGYLHVERVYGTRSEGFRRGICAEVKYTIPRPAPGYPDGASSPFWHKLPILQTPVTSVAVRASFPGPSGTLHSAWMSAWNKDGITWKDILDIQAKFAVSDGSGRRVTVEVVVKIEDMDSVEVDGLVECDGVRGMDGLCHCARVLTSR